MSNANDFVRIWIAIQDDKETKWKKLAGIFQNLLIKYNTIEIENALTAFNMYYPKSKIERFAIYCKRIISNERNKKELRDKYERAKKRNKR